MTGKTFPAFPAHAHLQFCVSGKRPMPTRHVLLCFASHTWSQYLLTLTLHWRHNELDGVSNKQPHDCFVNSLFRRRSKKTPKLRVTGLLRGNHWGPVNSMHKWPVTWKMFPFDDVIMIWKPRFKPHINDDAVLSGHSNDIDNRSTQRPWKYVNTLWKFLVYCCCCHKIWHHTMFCCRHSLQLWSCCQAAEQLNRYNHGIMVNSYPRHLVPKTTRTQDISYPRQLVPKTTRTQDDSYPRQTRTQDNSYPPRATRIQDNSYPRQLVPRPRATRALRDSNPRQIVPRISLYRNNWYFSGWSEILKQCSKVNIWFWHFLV